MNSVPSGEFQCQNDTRVQQAVKTPVKPVLTYCIKVRNISQGISDTEKEEGYISDAKT
jgi:hypothetical protein